MNFRKWIIPIFLLLLVSFLICIWLFSSLNENYNVVTEIKREVKNYVETKYRLTPSNIQFSFSIDGVDCAWVSTKEMPFEFQVYINRDNQKVTHDLYLESLSAYLLEKLVREKLNSFVDVNNIRVVLETRFSENSGMTVEKINDNPNILLSNPDISYFCSVDGVEIDSEECYLIFDQITQVLNPTCINFSFVEASGEEKYVSIKKNDFSSIQNKENLQALLKGH